MSNLWFSSDLHIGHDNILKHRREIGMNYSCVEEMNEDIIDTWNSHIRPRDLVWILGDVAFRTKDLTPLGRLNGRKILILGNHDKDHIREYLKYFEDVYGIHKKYGFVMSHVPIHPQEMVYRNWKVNVHGHIHHKEKDIGFPYVNVNWDILHRPIDIQELRQMIKEGEEKRNVVMEHLKNGALKVKWAINKYLHKDK
jgi:calcineurin-like phosphoesterase family protein